MLSEGNQSHKVLMKPKIRGGERIKTSLEGWAVPRKWAHMHTLQQRLAHHQVLTESQGKVLNSDTMWLEMHFRQFSLALCRGCFEEEKAGG